MMVSFIDENREEFGVEPICAQLPIAPSTYYNVKSRPPSARSRRDVAMIPLLVALWTANYRVYGAHKLWKAARRAGIDVGRDQVARLTRLAGIEGRRRRRVRTTRPDSGAVRPAEVVERDFSATEPNRLWVSDLTYVATWAGVAYVCFIVDAYSRMIVGWRVAAHMRTSMVLDALEMARTSRATRLAGLVAHSDAGSQGGFKWSSQHLVMEVIRGGCSGASGGGACVSWSDVVAGAALDGAARGSGPVLGGDRRWRLERGRGRCGWGVGGGWGEVVPSGWRDAATVAGPDLGPLSEFRRARGDRDPACPGRRGAGDRPTTGSVAVDDLP